MVPSSCPMVKKQYYELRTNTQPALTKSLASRPDSADVESFSRHVDSSQCRATCCRAGSRPYPGGLH
eukprot:scaffold163767_cov31-Attheya_sp.AAC.1